MVFLCFEFCYSGGAERSAPFNCMVDDRGVLCMPLKICCYCLLIVFCNILLVVFELLVRYLARPTKNPTSRDPAAQRIGDNWWKEN
jgi:hypothetical protein